ncbi:UxaA family hydrolase [Marinovum sp.]|uniref:UxaA family hydrolase n=1 Tax=Marinovum sp. TaxID=2024839 RepID=UPI002B26CC98|nr:UxaA family hydrolase [Marinovum sp.]
MTETSHAVRAVRLRPEDTVAVLTRSVKKGEPVVVSGPGAPLEISAAEDIPGYHKLALSAARIGDRPLRNGMVIGVFTAETEAGGWVHIHNLASVFSTGRHEGG